MLTGLYAITNELLMPGAQLLHKTTAALQAGCQWIQYRNKTAAKTQKLAEARQLLELCRQFGAKLIINDDVDLAATIAADGVHLGQDDESIAQARARVSAAMIIGATCHSSLALAQQASCDGANYAAFGRFFPSSTKPGASVATTELLGQATAQLTIPIVAIGGITQSNAKLLVDAGVSAIAICNEIFAPDSIAEIARRVQFFNSLFNATQERS